MKLKSLKLAGIALATLIVGLLAGCGGGGGGGQLSDADQIASNDVSFFTNWGKHNVNAAMGYVSPNFYEKGMNYDGLRASITASVLFSVSNFQKIEVDLDSTKTWGAINSSFVMTTNGQSQTIKGWTWWHKINGSWMLCGQDGRALIDKSFKPLAEQKRESLVSNFKNFIKK